jgi:hypothetical protein
VDYLIGDSKQLKSELIKALGNSNAKIDFLKRFNQLVSKNRSNQSKQVHLNILLWWIWNQWK